VAVPPWITQGERKRACGGGQHCAPPRFIARRFVIGKSRSIGVFGHIDFFICQTREKKNH